MSTLPKLKLDKVKTHKIVTEEEYLGMLEILPPQRMADNGFLVGEPFDFKGGYSRYEFYFFKDGYHRYGGLQNERYFNFLLALQEADELNDEDLEAVEKFISNIKK
jgi:hypothetical protein